MQVYNTFPWLMKWLPGTHRTLFAEIKKVINFVDLKIQEHRRNFDPSSPRDYIDCFLAEMGEVRTFVSVKSFHTLSKEMCQLMTEMFGVFFLLTERGC